MDFEYNEKIDKVCIRAYKDTDICAECMPFIRKVCPLLTCISANYVYPAAQSLEMSDCLLFSVMQNIRNGKYDELLGKDTDEDEPS